MSDRGGVFEVEEEHAGQRLDRFLEARLESLTRSRIVRLIKDGRVRVGDRSLKAGLELRAGERVEVEIPAPRVSSIEAIDGPLVILAQDADLAVVVKPAGLAIHPAPGSEEPTLVHRLLARLDDLSGIGGTERPGIVHRLDKDTTEVLVVAKSDRAHVELARQFHDREVEKRYVALVLGGMRAEQGVIERPIGRHPTEPGRMTSLGGRAERHARTDWELREDLHVASLLDLRIHTGRTHQIRAHLADEGHPVVGDERYGFQRRVRGFGDPQTRRTLESAPRPLLHAAVLGFIHPVSGEALRFEAPLPDDLQEMIATLRSQVHGTEDPAR